MAVDLRKAMEAGLTFPAAVKAGLEAEGYSIASFAEGRELNATVLSALIRGKARSPYERERDALADFFGISRAWLDLQIAQMED